MSDFFCLKNYKTFLVFHLYAQDSHKSRFLNNNLFYGMYIMTLA